MRRVQKFGQRSVVVKIARCAWPVAAGMSLWQPAALNAAPPPATWEGTTNAGGDNSLWTNIDNWTTNGVADVRPTNTPPGDDITIGNDTPSTISLGGNELADSLTFTANYTLDTTLSTSTLTLYTGSISVGSGVSATINSILAGNSGLKVSGGGTLTLTASQSYTGSTAINSGTVLLNNAHAIYTGNPLTVASSGVADINASMVFGSSITNSGNFNIATGDQVTFSTYSAVFTQSAGTLAITGTLNTGGVGFSYNGGTVTGTVYMGSTADQPNLTFGSSAGNSGTFIISGEGALLNATAVQSSQVIDFIPSDTITNDTLSSSYSFANAGLINIDGNASALATLTAGSNTITNTGTISTSNSSTVSTSSVLAYIGGVVNNTTGSISIGASTKMTGNVTNSASFGIASGYTLTLGTGNSFTEAGGTLAITGSMLLSNNTFNYNGGAIAGTVMMGNATSGTPTVSFGSSSVSTGTILFTGLGGVDSGNVPTGVTLTLQPTATSGILTVATGFTNNGNLNLIGNTSDSATLSATSTIFNSGTLTTSNTGSPTSVSQFIIPPLTNNTSGTVNINSSTTLEGAFKNFGTLNIASGQTLNYSSSSLNFIQEGQVIVGAGGTLDLSNATGYLYRGSITLTAGTTPAVLKLGFAEFGGTASTSNMTISSTTPGGGQSAGYVDLGNTSVDFAIGSATPAEDFIVSAPITDGGVNKTGSGTLVLSGNNSYKLGTNVSVGTLQVGAADAIPSTGGITLQSGGVMQFASSIGGVTTSSLSIDSLSDLDITNNHLFINYPSGQDPISSIAALINTGYSSGAWNGVGGIISTTAQTNPSYGIGYADSADPNNPAGLPTDTIEIAYTLLGDANLDGKVNGSDFTLMAANFNDSVTNGWDEGDFNYSNNVNGEDFVLLADNFNDFASQSAVSASDLAALDSFAAANGISPTSVPEPTCGVAMVVGVVSLLQTRLRSRRRDMC
jgi:fibronectin-binding autotransporter adhesin